MDEFKKCPNGHVYDSGLKECPYCSGKKIEDDLENLPEKPEVDRDVLKDIADCYLVV